MTSQHENMSPKLRAYVLRLERVTKLLASRKAEGFRLVSFDALMDDSETETLGDALQKLSTVHALEA